MKAHDYQSGLHTLYVSDVSCRHPQRFPRHRSRRGEMGLRMALGSTPRQLRRLMLGEGILVLSLSFLPAPAVCIHIAATGLISTKLMDNTCLRFAGSIFITYLLMALMVVLGIWYPASEAAAQEPVDALHEE